MSAADLQEIIAEKIKNLRPKLLDLSRRNPLILTRMSPRSASHIRVVDELPEILFFRLKSNQRMRLIALPDIDADPKDEETKAFRDAISNARLIDDAYLKAMDAVDRDAEYYLDSARRIERELKDRIREELRLPKRQGGAEVNLAQHARNNNITPSYDLPLPTGEAEHRHEDNDIQTLFLPKELERKLDAITAKCRTWVQETGINVLQVAYGFLEWSEPNQTGTSFAPLVLSSAKLEKVRTRNGGEYWIGGTGEDAELNGVLREKLRQFSIELPAFDGHSIEAYIAAVSQLAPTTVSTWKTRRQIAVGVFPSARMAMYHDLDPTHQLLHASDIVRSMLTGVNLESASPFGDEYNVDEPRYEAAVPHLVMDADSSQFSTLVDIAAGKNLAVEGPPGTGKSQTIVNAIAAALASGKKVLFVAEKLAALNVVRARLDAVGLGEFLLTLQAERSTREQVVSSIRDRIEMDKPGSVPDYEGKHSQFKQARSELAEYINLVTTPFKNSGFTVHDILGKSIASSKFDAVSSSILDACSIPSTYLTKAGLVRLQAITSEASAAHAATRQMTEHWSGTRLRSANRFLVEEVCEHAKHAGSAFLALSVAQERLSDFGIPADLSITDAQQLSTFLADVSGIPRTDAIDIIVPTLHDGAGTCLKQFTANCSRHIGLLRELAVHLAVNPTNEISAALSRVAALCSSLGFETLDPDQIKIHLDSWTLWLAQQHSLLASLEPLTKELPGAEDWLLADIDVAHRAIAEAGPTALYYRNNAAAEPGAASILRKACAEGRLLSEERQRLQAIVPLALDASIEDLSGWLATVRAAGALSVLSKRFRLTKRSVIESLGLAQFEKSTVCSTLERLVSFKRREKSFYSQPRVVALFGHHFAALDTDFAGFEKLASFYDVANSHFAGAQGRSIRQLLRVAPMDALELFCSTANRPDTDTFGTSTCANLKRFVDDTKSQLMEWRKGWTEIEQLAAVLKAPKHLAVEDLPLLIKQVEACIDLSRCLESDVRAKTLLGDRYRAARTDPAALEKICEVLPDDISNAALAASMILSETGEQARVHLRAVVDAAQVCDDKLNKLCDLAQTLPEHFLCRGSASQIAEFLSEASNDREGLAAHAALASHFQRLDECGAAPLAAHLVKVHGNLSDLPGLAEAAGVRAIAKSLCSEHDSKLSKFTGQTLDKLRSTLASQDRELVKLSRRVLRQRIHTNAKPPRGNGTGKRSTWTQKALLDNEIAKQKRFTSVRELTARAGQALLELKPCWMMSPLAVAQYIPKGSLQFDLCIIDEASQMPPEAAIGSLLRAKQIVVVGDTNQLPPSSFFRTMLDDDDADEDDNVLGESILEIANATFRPARRLRWHYRSRHSGLIRFSNRLVYDDNLVVFPSASEAAPHMGVEYKRVDGLYKAGTNPIEARVVVDAILEFMKNDPDRSLGVVTLNQKQRDLIREEFDYALASDVVAQTYVDSWRERNEGLEEFFVKNLENVQGDERDVIFIATVYGPETIGAKVHQRFGPINGLAGKRRLNVLFSRAKQKIVTFSSMTSADILADENGNQGAYMLKRWLDYAATGQLDAGHTTMRPPDSDFERFVSDQIRAMGLEPINQVGVAGYFIDIGVRHPDWPYGFVLGVECDGASYHSAKSARDRDRLRQEILEGLGWTLHRIWSTDWFNNPRREAERLRSVIDRRLNELKTKEQKFHEASSSGHFGSTEEAGSTAAHSPTNSDIVKSLMTESLRDTGVQPGDKVRIRYLDSDKVLQFVIHNGPSDPDRGLLTIDSQLARAVLGADLDDEIEVLVGSYVRTFVIEAFWKAGETEPA